MTVDSDLIMTDFSVFSESAVTMPESTVTLPEYLRIEKTKILGETGTRAKTHPVWILARSADK
uniref:Uncharacterized protein n=1 Tax=Candidatus Kentrum sp. MB TaxID=2138164 RepID=A0A451BGZ6_9GAMM|nr:MAG: hypothetical protein BECKMB1821G_GA0114241_11342 [Candidatus Kentron sp. MB]VFK35891.1 MAG: hypothetical protein BECKMB1821I_GA0114274_11582 [Candidatus Kentron sp. MB]VFK77538.1 MAG: hypothetical protein BECKMB1821H_GA0114242_11582 [Candidatus Kentron sp. MB]